MAEPSRKLFIARIVSFPHRIDRVGEFGTYHDAKQACERHLTLVSTVNEPQMAEYDMPRQGLTVLVPEHDVVHFFLIREEPTKE